MSDKKLKKYYKEEEGGLVQRWAVSSTFEVVSLGEFLRRVPRLRFDDRVYAYNTLVGYVDGPEGDAQYLRKAAAMVRGSESRVALNAILSMGTHAYSWKVPIQELYESMAVEYLKRFGAGDLIVKLGSRRYTVADPGDFAFVYGKQGVALICRAAGRLVVTEMYPVTERQAMDSARERLSAIGEGVKQRLSQEGISVAEEAPFSEDEMGVVKEAVEDATKVE